tara:strand:+ start:675 stop:959 length:285 start_codon:yes stop_codon:yes gene_type:complete
MDEKEIYKKLLEIEGRRNKHSIFLDLFICICFIAFIGWSITKDISQETERQRLNGVTIHQQIIIKELYKQNQEFRDTLQKLLDATDPKKTRSEA